MDRVRRIWERVHNSYWFLPLLITLAALGLATLDVTLDQHLGYKVMSNVIPIYSGGADGARSVLAAIAGSMITVAGTVFSITIAALTLASQQYGPRLLGNFMRDTGNQITFGTLVGTFLYCLVVLRTVSGAEDRRLVPHLSVTVGVGLAILSCGVLIYFIHHSASSMRPESLIASVGADLDAGIDRMFPERVGSGGVKAPLELPPGFDSEATGVSSGKSGYLQMIDPDGLMKAAKNANLVVRVRVRPGDYIMEGEALLDAWPPGRVDAKAIEDLRSAFHLGRDRSHVQDVRLSINQIVEIAVHALSPGINNPVTAMQSLNRLGSALVHLATRALPAAERRDADGQLRVITPALSYRDIVIAALDDVRGYAEDSQPVVHRFLEIIARVLPAADDEEFRAELLRQADFLAASCYERFAMEHERAAVRARHQQVVLAFERSRSIQA
jgi:uncharacterized membrane protein